MKYPALHNLTQFSGSWKYVKTEQSQQTVSLAKIMKRAHVKSFRRIMAGIKEHKQKIKVNCLTNELEVSDEIGFYSLHLDGLYHPLQHPLLGFCKAKVTFESSPNRVIHYIIPDKQSKGRLMVTREIDHENNLIQKTRWFPYRAEDIFLENIKTFVKLSKQSKQNTVAQGLCTLRQLCSNTTNQEEPATVTANTQSATSQNTNESVTSTTTQSTEIESDERKDFIYNITNNFFIIVNNSLLYCIIFVLLLFALLNALVNYC